MGKTKARVKKHPVSVYEQLAKLVFYDAETGVMKWLSRPGDKSWSARFAGKECGGVGAEGYLCLRFKCGQKVLHVSSHRLAWYIGTGQLPEQIDHRNQNKLDNRLANLRASSNASNRLNMPMMVNNTSGVTGVHWHKRLGKWRAQVNLNGKRYRLGFFADMAEAAAVVLSFRAKQGFAAIHGLAKRAP